MANKFLISFYRFFFDHLYHSWAGFYDAVAWTVSVGLWRGWVMQALPFVQGNRIFELGTGPGHLQMAMTDRDLNVVGLDESREMLRLTSKKILRNKKAGYNYGYAHLIKLARGHAHALPFETACFDTVVATFPTEYIALPQTLAEIYRVLAPAGRLVVVPVAWITGRRLHERAAAALFRITGQAPDWNPDFLLPIINAGFLVETHMIELPTSRVALLLATKQ